MSIEQADIAIDVVDILLYTIDVLLSLVDFAIKHHEVLQTFLHVGLIAAESFLLLLDFLCMLARCPCNPRMEALL